MNEETINVVHEHLPFYITGPGESDILFTAVTVFLIGVVVGFGVLYFTIQAIPDRIAEGTSKAQMQVVGLLGLISLFTMNNLYWIAAILLAAVRLPDFVTPLTEIAREIAAKNAAGGVDSAGEPQPENGLPEAPSQEESVGSEVPGETVEVKEGEAHA